MSSERLLYSASQTVKAVLYEDGVRLLEQTVPSKTQYKKEHSAFTSCFASRTSGDTYKNEINFKDILWCERIAGDESNDTFEILYVDDVKKESIESAQVRLISSQNSKQGLSLEDLRAYILDKAYENSQTSPRILILINPFGGQGKAAQIYKEQILPVLKAARANVVYKETKYRFHASDIARTLDADEYDIIACCSGDGIPHEVINGFYEKPDRGLEAFEKIAITQLPCGSGNALSLSTHGSNDAFKATVAMLKSQRAKLDLMAVTQGTGDRKRTRLSFLSQCYGLIADSDIGTENLRWMGAIRFELGIVQRVFTRSKYGCDIFIKYKTNSKTELDNHFNEHYNSKVVPKKLSPDQFTLHAPDLDQPIPEDWEKYPDTSSENLTIFYVGKLPYISSDAQFFPCALPNDGAMDMVIVDTNASIIDTTSILLSISNGTHVDHSKVHHAKVLCYRLIPKIKDSNDHYISVDGESFPFEPFQVELLPAVMTGLLYDGKYVETKSSLNFSNYQD